MVDSPSLMADDLSSSVRAKSQARRTSAILCSRNRTIDPAAFVECACSYMARRSLYRTFQCPDTQIRERLIVRFRLHNMAEAYELGFCANARAEIVHLATEINPSHPLKNRR